MTFWIGLPLSAIAGSVWVLRRCAVPDRTVVAAGIGATVMTALAVFGTFFALAATCIDESGGSGSASDEVQRLCTKGNSGVELGLGLILLLPATGTAAGVLLARRGKDIPARGAYAAAFLSPIFPSVLIALLV